MTDIPMVLLIGSFLLFIALRVPIAFALALASFATVVYCGLPLELVVIKMVGGLDSFTLMAIPFFILAGQIIGTGGIARRLIDFAGIVVGRLPGGLSLVNIFGGMMFGTISGSAIASASAIGSAVVPEMTRKGYDPEYAVSVTISSATQALMIPPSHNAIIYAMAAGGGISIAKLFIAGIIPGVLVGVGLMAVSMIVALRRGYPAVPKTTLRESLRITIRAIPALLTVVIIMGGILSGIFTATESSAVAVAYAFFLTFICYREVPMKEFVTMLKSACGTISMVLFLIAAASAYGWLMTYLNIPERMTETMLSLTSSPILLLLIINVMLLVLGCIMDMAPLLVILTPILLPVAKGIGVDPIHFGMIMLLNLGIGLCTPPVGSVLFVGCSVGKTTLERVVKAMIPFYVAMAIALLMVTYIPALSTWLPDLLVGTKTVAP